MIRNMLYQFKETVTKYIGSLDIDDDYQSDTDEANRQLEDIKRRQRSIAARQKLLGIQANPRGINRGE